MATDLNKSTYFGISPFYTLSGFARLCALLVFGGFYVSVAAGPVDAAGDIATLIGPKDALLVTAPDGSDVFAVNESVPRIPASTLKLLTSLAALHYLGPNYQFATDFYMDENRNLKIKGFGDPLLISEVVAQIVDTLVGNPVDNPLEAPFNNRARDLIEINDIVLDDSYFSQPIIIPGRSISSQPYDAPNGALCANFNTIQFKKSSAGNFISSESQTPLVPFVLPKLRASGLKSGRIVLSHRNGENVLYVGHLFQDFFKRRGIACRGVVRTGKINSNTDQLILHHLSPFTMEQIIQKLLKHSNNFIANQLLIAIGTQSHGPPGNLEKGVQAVRGFANKKLGLQNFQLVEGSGISRKNRVSARALSRILDAFLPYRHLMTQKGRTHYKTGSLSGISTRAGFIESRFIKSKFIKPKLIDSGSNEKNDRALYRYIVLMNTPGKSAEHVVRTLLKRLP